MDKIISELFNTSSRETMPAPASTYFSSEANAFSPAVFSIKTSTFIFFKFRMCSGKIETLVSGNGSFKTPIIIIQKYDFLTSRTLKPNGKILPGFKILTKKNQADKKKINCQSD